MMKVAHHELRSPRHTLRPTLRAGFTLVEILVAMGILGLVLTAIYSTWTAILRSSKVGLEAAAAVQRARIAARVVEESLGSVQAYAANQDLYYFAAKNGDEASLSFVTRLAKSFPRSGKFGDLDMRRVTFTVEPGAAGGDELVLRQNPLLMELDIDEREHPVVLAKNVRKFLVEFWDNKKKDWIDEWKQTNQLPALVKVTLQLADNPNSRKIREEVVRIVSLPSVTVQPIWQIPGGGMPAPASGLPAMPPPGAPAGMLPQPGNPNNLNPFPNNR
jgi:general secretion pathway protein J